MNLTKRIFLPLATIILLLCFTMKPTKIEAKQEINYLHSSKISQTRIAKHSNRLMPLSLPKAGEAKASLPHMRRIALNPTQYQITLKNGVDETKRDIETSYSDQSSTKTDGADGQESISEPREYSVKLNSQSRVNDKQLLYSLVQAEAGNQDVDGCRLVADVVLNRMASEKFPSDMESVIYSPGQFSVVRNGALKKAQGEISQKVIQAVDMELSGKQLNNDVLYFNNRPNGGWQYGGHYFK